MSRDRDIERATLALAQALRDLLVAVATPVATPAVARVAAPVVAPVAPRVAAPPTARQPEPMHYLRVRALAARWGVSTRTLWRMRQSGQLPEPTRLTPKLVGWRVNVIEALEAARQPRTQPRTPGPRTAPNPRPTTHR